ncbi:MAG: UTRA domain-containing protein [Luteitalea sp.]|nr:UTRA domain-containing protein [Luteitalea sp.]
MTSGQEQRTPRRQKVNPGAMVRKESPIPLYYQLKTAIEARIEEGGWPPDTQLPSERQLCDQFGISRITVRQALAELVREGRLVRSHGRGTYVAQAHLKKPVFPLVSFTEDLREHGLQAGARVLRFERTTPPPHVSLALRLAAGDKTILLQRLRLANHRPVAIETVHLPDRLCAGFLDEDMADRSLYATLGARYHIVPARARQQWQAVRCAASDAQLLAVPKGSPVLRIDQTTYDQRGRAFEYMESFFRGDKFIFFAELTNHSRVTRRQGRKATR